MRSASYHILRVGMAVTFLWIGILILKQPEVWGGYLQPWAAELLPIPIGVAMFITALLDISIGIFLLVNILTWHAALLGALHLAIVLTVSGINAITVRDVGLFAGVLSLAASTWPNNLQFWIKKDKGQ